MRAALLAAAIAIAVAAPARAQQAPAGPPEPPDHDHGASIPGDALERLPLTAQPLDLFGTAMPDGVTDRFDTGGLNVGESPRLVAHTSSPMQATFRLGPADITDPDGSGAPLLLPDVLAWERVDFSTSASQLPLDAAASGPVIRFAPRRPAAAWGGSVGAFGAFPAFVSPSSTTIAPPITRLDNWNHAGLFAGGPIARGTRMAFAVDWTHGARVDMDSTRPRAASVGSLFAHVDATPDDRDRVGLIVWAQAADAPFGNHVAFATPFARRRDFALNLGSTWNHRLDEATTVEMTVNYAARHRAETDRLPGPIVVERLQDGPVSQLLYPGPGTTDLWTAAAQLTTRRTAFGLKHQPAIGVSAFGAGATERPAIDGLIGELVNGLPARIWDFASAGASQWGSTVLVAYAADTVPVGPRVTASGGIRFESVTGSAAGATTGISWRNWLPRASVRWQITDAGQLAVFSSYGRYGNRLPLTMLAYGDPSAASGAVYRWNAAIAGVPSMADAGPLVARAGPGTGGDPRFAAIDPNLRRPYVDEAIIGVEGQPHGGVRVRLEAIARREQHIIGVTDVGPQYTVTMVPDTYIDIASAADDQLLPEFSRVPASFGADRYVLTNPSIERAWFEAFEATTDVRAGGLWLIAGATAFQGYAYAGSRGYQVTENDPDTIGELFVDPNASTYAWGHPFGDRSYTIRIGGTYRLPYEISAGAIARYSDGQPFARLVVAPDLTQGPDIIRAYPNGGSRFTFAMTVDARLEKTFRVRGRQIDAILDAYNLLNQSKEVEEFTVTGTANRDLNISAVQPPRAIHVGARLRF